MATTVQQLIDEVKGSLNLPTTDTTTYTDSWFISEINGLYDIIAAKGYSEQVEVQVAVDNTTRRYFVKDGIIKVIFAYIDGESTQLGVWSPFSQAFNPTQTGKPTHYFEDNEYVVLFPFPDTNYNINFYAAATPDKITTVSDTISFAPLYVQAIKAFLTAKAFLREESTEADKHFQIYAALLDQAVNVDADRRSRQFAGSIKQGTEMRNVITIGNGRYGFTY
jgi:hypothetical protein